MWLDRSRLSDKVYGLNRKILSEGEVLSDHELLLADLEKYGALRYLDAIKYLRGACETGLKITRELREASPGWHSAGERYAAAVEERSNAIAEAKRLREGAPVGLDAKVATLAATNTKTDRWLEELRELCDNAHSYFRDGLEKKRVADAALTN